MSFKLDLRTAASISMILTALAFGTVMVYHEIVHKNEELTHRLVGGEEIEEASLGIAGPDEFWVKKELRSWGDCLKPFFPLAIAVMAWFAKGKRKGK